jgi:hypothetical protein
MYIRGPLSKLFKTNKIRIFSDRIMDMTDRGGDDTISSPSSLPLLSSSASTCIIIN